MSTESARLKNFPISWFAMVMGLAGFTIAWSRAEDIFGLGFALSPVLLALTAGVFVALAGLFAAKA